MCSSGPLDIRENKQKDYIRKTDFHTSLMHKDEWEYGLTIQFHITYILHIEENSDRRKKKGVRYNYMEATVSQTCLLTFAALCYW